MSYPPGAASDPYAPYNQPVGPCEICYKAVENCVCDACPECDSVGDPKCYQEHGLLLNENQRAAIEERNKLQYASNVVE